MNKLSPTVKRAQRLQHEMEKLTNQLNKAVLRAQNAEKHKKLVMQRMKAKVDEANLFFSQL